MILQEERGNAIFNLYASIVIKNVKITCNLYEFVVLYKYILFLLRKRKIENGKYVRFN